jgi:hypothetical protein
MSKIKLQIMPKGWSKRHPNKHTLLIAKPRTAVAKVYIDDDQLDDLVTQITDVKKGKGFSIKFL